MKKGKTKKRNIESDSRQQILDGTGVQALHPVEVLYNALIDHA